MENAVFHGDFIEIYDPTLLNQNSFKISGFELLNTTIESIFSSFYNQIG